MRIRTVFPFTTPLNESILFVKIDNLGLLAKFSELVTLLNSNIYNQLGYFEEQNYTLLRYQPFQEVLFYKSQSSMKNCFPNRRHLFNSFYSSRLMKSL
jgi:hypothetical protein